MRTGAHQSQFVAGDAVDQEPVRLDVSFPIALPDPPERVIERACRQWFLPDQRREHRPELAQVPVPSSSPS